MPFPSPPPKSAKSPSRKRRGKTRNVAPGVCGTCCAPHLCDSEVRMACRSSSTSGTSRGRITIAVDARDDMSDTDEKGPERTCIVTRHKASPDAMIRFVVGPDAAVVPDIRCKLPGRGVWVTASQPIVAEAVRKQAFARGFKAKVKADADLAGSIDHLLAADALQSLAMMNKAGAITTGFAKVEAAIAGGKAAAVLHASDGGEDGIRKLEAVSRRLGREERGPPSIKLFASEQLDLALGRTNVIHAALAVGSAGHAFLTRCHRLMSYRSAGLPSDANADAKTAPA